MADGGVEDQIRARRAARAAQAREAAANLSIESMGTAASASSIAKGVTVGWLATAFQMDTRTVSAKLRECPPLKMKQGGTGYLYDLRTAAGYLIKPVVDLEDYMKTVKVEDLPIRFQEGYWGAQIKKQKWEENAGQLWRTATVAQKFSETFLMIAGKMKMWVDNLESRVALPPDVRKVLEAEVRDLQLSINQSLRDMNRATRATIAEAPDITPQQTKKTPDDDIQSDISDVV